MRINPEGLAVPIPERLLSLTGFEWQHLPCDEPAGFITKEPMGQVLFAAQGCDLRVIASYSPVLIDGVPYAALIFEGADHRTSQAIVRRLLRLMVDSGVYLDGIKEICFGAKASGALDAARPPLAPLAPPAPLLVAVWDCRTALRRAAGQFLNADPTLQRALQRTVQAPRRAKYDASVVRSFELKGRGMKRHLVGPFERRWRFSDFTINERVSFAGVTLLFEFEDYDLLEHAERTLRDSARRTGGTRHVSKVPWNDSAILDDHTDMIQPSMTMTMRWNTRRSRHEMARLISEICGVSSSDEPPSSLPQSAPSALDSAAEPSRETRMLEAAA